MNLSELLPSITKAQSIYKISEELKRDSPINLDVNMPDAAKAAVMATIHHISNKSLFIIEPDSKLAERLYDEINFWLGKSYLVQLFPEHDLASYDDIPIESINESEWLTPDIHQ